MQLLRISNKEVVWLLLWLASGVQTLIFPKAVSQAAVTMGAGKGTARGPDIRGLRYEQGQDVAGGIESTWAGLLGVGVLK